MDEQKVYEYTYTNDKDGKRVLDKESEEARYITYLKMGGINTEKFALNLKARNSLYKTIADKLRGKYDEPKIFISEENDLYQDVFSVLVTQAGQWEKLKRGERSRYPYFKVIDISYVTQQQISGEYHDPSIEFDNILILCVKLNYTDLPNYFNAYCIRNLAEARKGRGLYTYFYFRGTNADFNLNKWKIDENGDGQRSVIYTENGVVDTRTFIPLSKYIDVIDLNVLMKGRGGKK